ncbi:MAG: hypothetical protein RID53_10260 [Coleofasciculus sp. B1-GNL1-01]|uniref:hypothetical protein n=1 Tax=Coleofasciculus sp. B1-GNL1-01 TaxID=3068484 RepID=UPI0032F16BE3
MTDSSDRPSAGNPTNRNEQPESRHAVAERKRCYEMEEKYRWTLLRIEPTGDKTLKYNCVFEGQTEFPNYMMED